MASLINKKEKRKKRHARVRGKISGTSDCPRLCVFRSLQHVYCQLVNDEKGRTIVAASDLEIKKSKSSKSEKGLTGKKALAFEVGKLIAEKAQEKKIKKVVFDRGGFTYHGRIKALADGAREGGLEF